MQVTKDPLKTKGARLTMQLSIPGRYMVFVPQGEGVGVSRRLEDKERMRLTREDRAASTCRRRRDHPHRRAAARPHEDFVRELAYLHMLNEVLDRRADETSGAGDDLPGGRPLDPRDPRRLHAASSTEALIDDEAQYERVKSFLQRTAPELVDRVELLRGAEARCSRSTASRRRSTRSSRAASICPRGGYLIIDHTEALTVIDVNTGSLHRPRQGRGLEETITQGQPRGRRRGRAPAPPARHRRHHRHRLHRHGAREQPRRGAEDDAQGARRGPHQDPRGRDLAARPGRDDAPERHRRRARDHDQALPGLRRRGRRALRGDGRDPRRAPPPRRRRREPEARGVPGAGQPARHHAAAATRRAA